MTAYFVRDYFLVLLACHGHILFEDVRDSSSRQFLMAIVDEQRIGTTLNTVQSVFFGIALEDVHRLRKKRELPYCARLPDDSDIVRFGQMHILHP